MAAQQENNQKKSVVVFRAIGLLLLFGVLVFAVARVIIGSSLNVENQQVLSVDTQGDVLYAVSPESVADVCAYENGIAVLTDSEMLYFDAAGSITRSDRHSYGNPCMAAFDRSVLVYDRGNRNYRMEINAAVFDEYTTDADLLTAAVGKNGNYAVATLADGGYQSKLYVYAQDGTLLFEWGSAKHFITGIALSDDGKHYAVSLAGSENAVYNSSIQAFEKGKTQPVFTWQQNDLTVLKLDYMKNDTLCFVTDAFVSFVEDGEQDVKLEYNPTALLSVDLLHGERVAVLLSSGYVDEENHRIYMWNDDGHEMLNSSPVSPQAMSLSLSAKHFAVCDAKNITVYDRKGAFSGEAKTGYNIEVLQVVGNQVFCLHENGFTAFSVHARLAKEPEITK